MPLASDQPRRVGVFGGTFDPIHIGHLILAEEARSQLALDWIYFVPAGDPPHKQERSISPVEERIRMAELATAENAAFLVSRIDADRPGPHYTTDTLQLLQAELGVGCELYFLMGLDSLRDLPNWHNPHWLVTHCRLVVFNRPEISLEWAALETALPGVQKQVTLLHMPEIAISSTALRERIRTGQPIRYQVPTAVAAYLRKHRLYR
jgi:nicotinate-nucleotide adenylyltransferase